jgi:hypothetical protein
VGLNFVEKKMLRICGHMVQPVQLFENTNCTTLMFYFLTGAFFLFNLRYHRYLSVLHHLNTIKQKRKVKNNPLT